MRARAPNLTSSPVRTIIRRIHHPLRVDRSDFRIRFAVSPHLRFFDLEEKEEVFCKLEFCKATNGGYKIRGEKEGRIGSRGPDTGRARASGCTEERRGELWPHSSPLSGESLRERPNLDVRALTAPILVRRYPLRAPTTPQCISTGRIIVCINAIRKSPPDLQFPLAARECAHDTRRAPPNSKQPMDYLETHGFFPDEYGWTVI